MMVVKRMAIMRLIFHILVTLQYAMPCDEVGLVRVIRLKSKKEEMLVRGILEYLSGYL